GRDARVGRLGHRRTGRSTLGRDRRDRRRGGLRSRARCLRDRPALARPRRDRGLLPRLAQGAHPVTDQIVRLAMPRPELRESFIRAAAEFPYDEETLAYERDLATRNFDHYVKAA